MKAIWKGHIRFSLVTIPVQIYNAIENKSQIRFRQLHKTDHGPVGYDKVCRECQQTVKSKDIVKGYEYEPDRYVVIEPADIDKVKLKSTRIIEIEGFVDAKQVHPTRFEACYFAGPDGEVGMKAYELMRKTLEKTGKAGIGRIIMRDREDVVLITPHKKGLIIYKLRYPYEIRKVEDIPEITEVDTDEKQMTLAETLVASMSMDFGEVDFEDRFRDALMEMINSKIAGEEIVTIDEEDTPVVDIMTALKKSIEQAKKSDNSKQAS